MAGIFKAYDIRGIYGETLTTEIAEKIGRAFTSFLKCGRIVVGRDMRSHTPPLFDALSRGLIAGGADVVDLGLCSTPMSYFANGLLKADGGIMITASHNPSEWNGFKLCREQAIPISGDTGIADIEKLVLSKKALPAPRKLGTITQYDVGKEYAEHVARHAAMKRPVRIAADFANAMGIYEARALKGLMQVDPLFDTLDGAFPNHEANPLKHETLAALRSKVGGGGYDFGVAFDGDADRAGFVDEKGNIVPMDAVTALIAKSILRKKRGTILYDLRSSWAVKETIKECGGKPKMCRVGHAFIKRQMREAKAVFAGELSGHYYFKDNYYAESAAMAALFVANIVSASPEPLSELIKPIRRYFASGEINSEIEHPDLVLPRLRDRYVGGKVITMDGLSVEYADWWFNVRCSNTEPLVRLNLEAKTRETMMEKRDEVLGVIRAQSR